jgi:hypothetical protein
MNPIVRVLGKVLRLVGISSPEDNLPKEKDPGGPPSWRDRATSSEPPQSTPKK